MSHPPLLRRAAGALLAATAAVLGTAGTASATNPFPVTETFSHATAGPSFVLGHSALLTAAAGDADGAGWLRLTGAFNNQDGYVFDDDAFPSAQGIQVEFDYATWGGSGADGIVFFLYDGTTTAGQFAIGPLGGSLGYTSCPAGALPGLSNAYIGLALDEYGNFSNSSFCNQNGGFSGSINANRFVVRGGSPTYAYLTSVAASQSLAADRAHARHVSLTVLPNGKLYAQIRYPDGELQTVANGYQLPVAPATLKYGFVAGTGGLNNNHEIRATHVVQPTDLTTTVSDGHTTQGRGSALGWTATVTNNGPNDATGVDITSTSGSPGTPANLAWTCAAGTGATCGAPSGSGNLATTADIPVGAHVTYTVSADAGTSDYGQLQVDATLPSTSAVGEMLPADNAASDTTDLVPLLDASPSYVLGANGIATATPSTVHGRATSRTWQWQRCAPDGTSCADIAGATSQTYPTTEADLASNLRVVQTETNVAGTSSGHSGIETLPVTTISSGPDGLQADAGATFAFSSSRASSVFRCSLDGAAFTECASPHSLTALSEGAHSFRVQAVYGGLGSAVIASRSFTVDTTPPAVPTLDGAPATPSSSASPTFVLGSEPGARYRCRIDGAEWVTCGSPFQLGTLSDGTHTLFVESIDAAGNVSPERGYAWTVDTTAPAAPVVATAPDQTTASHTATFELSSEPGASLQCSLDHAPYTACASTVELQDLATGAHTLDVRQVDAAGNTGTPLHYAWTVTRTQARSQTATHLTSQVPASLAAHAGSSVRVGCAVDRGSYRACTVTLVLQTPSGPVLLGTTTLRGNGHARGVAVVHLNARGRRLLRLAHGGLPVTIQQRAGTSLRRTLHTTLRTETTVELPVVAPFGLDAGTIDGPLRAILRAALPDLRAAKRVTCEGYTDSNNSAAQNHALGLKRARTVCAALKALGVKGTLRAVSFGETRPRASNATHAGRELNRRVVLRVTF